jgi:tryptophan synthase alpha chain
MSVIRDAVSSINERGEKALSVFLTAGYPGKEGFVSLALDALAAGADMLEIGIPFSDPLADGSVIQGSSQVALQNGVTLTDVFRYTEEIRKQTDKPLILMGYANPAYHYGRDAFFKQAVESGANGLIIPDVPLEEYEPFFSCCPDALDTILLTTPASRAERISAIDEKSRGFVYCVSVLGTTGERKDFSEETLASLSATRTLVKKNKMLVGFGIANAANIEQVKPHGDGVIVGSAVIRSLQEHGREATLSLISSLKRACL